MSQYFGRELVTIKQACALTGVTRRTIDNWRAHGKVQFVRTAGGAVRMFADTLSRPPDIGQKPASGREQDRFRGGQGQPSPSSVSTVTETHTYDFTFQGKK